MKVNSPEGIFISGIGAVSPAGWGVAPFREALGGGAIPTRELARPGWEEPLRIRQVPAPSPRPAFLAHARLRRTSPIAHYAVAAALEALGAEDAARCSAGGLRLGVVYCAMSGCVNYSRRFFDEVLKDPATASPLVFPETVYNSPASHLAALLGTAAINYTLVGDPGTFLQGIALGADWLAAGRLDGCLVAGAEEIDWLAADAMRLFSPETIMSDGAGALYLKPGPDRAGAVRLRSITNPHLFGPRQSRAQAARRARSEASAGGPRHLLCDSRLGLKRADRAEEAAWFDWPGPRLSPRTVFGEGLMSGAAWQCVAAVDGLQQSRYDAATVSVVGCNQQAIAAEFVRE